MPENPFIHKDYMPDEDSLQSVLGQSYPFYQAIFVLVQDFKQEWHFYASGGWVHKVFEAKKVLFHLLPLPGQFRVHLTLREMERDALLGSPSLAFAKETLQSAPKYPEGYTLFFLVSDELSCQQFLQLLCQLIDLRKGRPSCG